MGFFERFRNKTVAPEEVAPEQLSDLSRSFLNWKSGMTLSVGVILAITFMNTFLTGPSITGSATVSESTRFAGTFSLLLIIFGAFAIILLLFRHLKHHAE